MKEIKSFKGKNFYLDNFYPYIVEFESMIFPSVEHTFQGAKTLDMNERKCFAHILIQNLQRSSADK